MRARRVAAALLAAAIGVVPMRPAGRQAAQTPVFRSSRELVSVDAIVRDRAGNVVRGLGPQDFEIREDGRQQEVLTVSFQEISDRPASPAPAVDLLADVRSKVLDTRSNAAPSTPAPLAPETLAGRRLIVLVFDTASMQPDDVQRAVDSANKYVSDQMSEADLVAVATVGTMLDVLTDFTGDKEQVTGALNHLAATDGTAAADAAASTVATDETQASATADDTTATDATELDLFNNDIRLRALKTLADALGPVEQKKSIIYFSTGMERNGQDNQIELRAAINAAVRANVSIYAVDTRGLQAVVPGGDARQASGTGVSLFNGKGVSNQFDKLASSQDTLVSLSGDTGGQAFTDTNDFGEAFTRVQRDTSAYYLVGYSSTNPVKDGRFRRIQVRVKRDGVRVEARAGYYADRDFAHTANSDRETELQEQLTAAVSSTDVPVMVGGGWFRLAADRYYVPISVAVPGSAVPVAAQAGKASLDVLGAVRDEQGRPVGRFRQTLQLPAGPGATLAGKQVLYQTGLTLPPGRFSAKVVVRENATGKIGSFEAPLVVPDLKRSTMKVSSVVLSTQLQPAPSTRGDNPLVREGVQLLPNLTRVVARDQKLYFYYEVYDPSVLPGAAPDLQTSLAFYRKKVKVFETPAVTRTQLDAPDRHAALFQFEVPAEQFTPGLYTCQINIIDEVAGHFAFPRLAFFVRPPAEREP